MRVLVASDGSAASRAALGVALGFPWPPGARVRGVVALGRIRWGARPEPGAASVRALHARADEVRKALKRKWRDADVVELHDRPAQAILREAERFRADIIVIGWRGHGALARAVAGSVSRSVAQDARCPVLVVRGARSGARAAVRRLALGFDASENAGRAIRFIARLPPPRGNRVALISVLQALSPPRAGAQARGAARRLRAGGWQPEMITRTGAPVDELIGAAAGAKAQLLVVGAASRAGLERLVLGSVASGILNRSRLPVLIVR